jgi:D,D-heptose 1,7-bisphosphate phosphatase
VKAVFFDKDGTLTPNLPYNVNTDLIELIEDAGQAVQLLKKAGFKLFVISNQSGVARGFFEEKDLIAVWQKINELCGVEFDGFYYCPHYRNAQISADSFECDCRKPQPGMLFRAAREHHLNLKKSWMIGDNDSDVEAGRRAGCRTILFRDNDQTKLMKNNFGQSDFTVQNLCEAAKIILAGT